MNISINHGLYINASKEKVFEVISTPNGFNNWWTKGCKGKAEINTEFNFNFTNEYNWFAKVTKLIPNKEIEFSMTVCSENWENTKFGFTIEEIEPYKVFLNFEHSNWESQNKEFQITSYCWAHLFLLLKNYIENNNVVPFEQRNDHL
ncbi:MAG: SRPBCC domain-containing protein [Flavobacterium sp.]|jgi:uncharacterized protein YndB with AHSA1/START domain